MTKTEESTHNLAPLFYGWNFVGFENGKRKYTRGKATAIVSPGHILLNGKLPIEYINIAVWEAINQVLDSVATNGPTRWARPIASFECRNASGQIVKDVQWSNGKVTSEIQK